MSDLSQSEFISVQYAVFVEINGVSVLVAGGHGDAGELMKSARLIEAAPVMLAALAEIAEFCGRFEGSVMARSIATTAGIAIAQAVRP